MAIDDPGKIDAAGIERSTGFVVLTIVDAWDWSDVRLHMQSLASKLDSYVASVESGEVFQAYPLAKGRQVVIDIVNRFPPPEECQAFLEDIRRELSHKGLQLRQRTYTGHREPT